MKSICTTFFLLTLFCALGCSKKEPPSHQPAPQETSLLQTVTETAADMGQNAAALRAELKEPLGEIDLAKSLEVIRQEASTMDLTALKETALRYKETLLEKEAAFKLVADKLAKIPLAERLSTDAQALAVELKTLAEPIKALTERLAVYVEAFKARGGDATQLTL